MKNIYTRLLNALLSLVTTFLLMAAPVAAIVYAAEPVAQHDHYIEEEFTASRTSKILLKNDWFTEKVKELTPDFLDNTLASALTGLKKR